MAEPGGANLLTSALKQRLDEHINDLVKRLSLAVAQGSVLTHFDYADTSISEKHPQQLRSLVKRESFCVREVSSWQIAAPEHVDIEMKQNTSGRRHGCENL
jgi:hypothetical protein